MAVQQRLESLDALRGLDLFFLVGLEGVLHPLSRAVEAPWFKSFMWNFTHVEWEGFSPWDLVMPLFLFMAGVSIPFALGRSKGAADNTPVYRRISRRFVLLWLFGMMCQGNLLGLDPSHLYLYSNTLQTIAVGYVIAALLFLHTSWKTQTGIALALLLAYWAALEGISVDGFGGGDYTPDGNLAEWVDRTVLGRFRDGATVDASGAVVFAPWYRYTWLLSSGNFGVTVLSGCQARRTGSMWWSPPDGWSSARWWRGQRWRLRERSAPSTTIAAGAAGWSSPSLPAACALGRGSTPTTCPWPGCCASRRCSAVPRWGGTSAT